MAFATFSDENIVATGLRDLGISTNFLCAMVGRPSAAMVNLWLGGFRQLDSSMTRPLAEMIRSLQRIRDLAAPWPLSFRDPRRWKQLLADYEANRAAEKSGL